jgi:hypothetical protein
MKRLFAVVALLAALGVLSKLALKGTPGRPGSGSVAGEAAGSLGRETRATPDDGAALRARYAGTKSQPLVDRTWDKYRQTALAVERTDGVEGLVLLDRLDLEAIFLYEKYPKEFRRLRDALDGDAAADLLLHWREYFGLKRADETDRSILISEIAHLSPAQRRAASRYPAALPLILADPAGVTELIERKQGEPKELGDSLMLLDFISLEPGSAGLRAALRTLDTHGALAIEAFRKRGMEGFALVKLYGDTLLALDDAMPLDQALIVLRVNADYVDQLSRTSRPEALAGHLRHVAAAGLTELVGGSPGALRLVVEHGVLGEKALRQAGPDAADVVYGDYADDTLRNRAVEALAEHGTMALAMLDKYAIDPDFREILRDKGAAVIPPLARADAGPETLAYLRSKSDRTLTENLARSILAMSGENGQATIRLIKKDGLERVAELDQSGVEFRQFLPLYDLLHLGSVLVRGHSPTNGELSFALMDGAFVVVDVLSLAAIQPEGAVAAEAARAELKVAVREAAKTVGREAGEVATKSLGRKGIETTADQLSKWWAVRMAGGTYKVLRRLPEALPRMSLLEVADLGRPLCEKAGMKLSTWAPRRLLTATGETLLTIPPASGLSYLAKQGAMAGVGVVGFQKMEEHLASRRPQKTAE